jgi:transposase
MGFCDLSDDEWVVIKPLLPPRFRVGRLGLMIDAS